MLMRGTYNERSRCFSVGRVIRDYRGNICAATTRRIRHPDSVDAAEVTTIYLGMQLAVQGEFSNVKVYSDSVLAVQAVTKA